MVRKLKDIKLYYQILRVVHQIIFKIFQLCIFNEAKVLTQALTALSSPVLPPRTDKDSESDSQDLCVEGESSRNLLPGSQTNNISIKNLSAPTTLVINSSPSTSSTFSLPKSTG